MAGDFLRQMQALAEASLDCWDLGAAALVPIKVRENAVFRIDLEGGGRAVLRVHRPGYHSDSELESEFAWLNALESAGVQVPRIIPSRRGRNFESVTVSDLDGPRQIDVFEWIEGRQLGSIEAGLSGSSDSVADQYHQIGTLAARMHNHAQGWRPPSDFRRHSWDAAGLVGEQPFWGRFWDLDALSHAQRDLLLRLRGLIACDLADYGVHADRYSLIHADLVPENLLIDGSRVCVIDFDDAGFGWHLFELATSLYFITGDSTYSAARDALIRGYRSERALGDAALERLPLFLAVRGTTYLGWVHTRQGTDTANEMTPFLIERACAVAEEYLASR
jgi:Ser/Thr protein kinase RdoA (MazF antagonist)